MTHQSLLRLLALGSVCSLASCEALWHDASRSNGRSGAYGQSLDNPPPQNRYLGDPNSAPSHSIEGPDDADGPMNETDDSSVDSSVSAPPSEAPPPPPPAPSPPTSSQPSYGTPVPGKRGFVYPPGVEAKTENMVDVRDFTPGQKVRDPRTGKIFLVP